MFLKGKKSLILTIVLSLFAVSVTAVATMAWFRVNEVTVPSVTNSSKSQTDSTSLTINNVTGYKFKYNDVSYGVTDYENGEAIAYDSSTVENADQADRKDMDYPAQGEGYYIVGNASWVNDYNTETGSSATSDTVWTYASGLRLDDDNVEGNNNIATYNNIFLSAGTIFRLRHHYLTVNGDQTQTESYSNSWVTSVLDSTSQTTTAAEIDGDNIKIKAGQSGYYNIYFTNAQKVSFYLLEARATPRSLGKRIPQRSLTNGEYIYFVPTSNWSSAGARTACYFYNSSGNSWYSMIQMQSTGIYYAEIPKIGSSAATTVIFCRMNGATPENNWNNKWNQTQDLSLSSRSSTSNLFTPENTLGQSMSGTWSNASTSVLNKFSDTFAHADAKNSWAQTALTTAKSCEMSGGTTTVTFTSSTSIKLYATSQFKIVNTSNNFWMGYAYLSPKNATYFSQGDRADGAITDYNVNIVKNCKCTFAITYYFSDNGWSFAITPTDFSPSFFEMHIYKKNYSTGALTLVHTLEHEAADITELYYPGDPSGLSGYSSIEGYSTWDGSWYSNAGCTTAIPTSGVSGGSTYGSPVVLHTFYTADNLSVTTIYSFLTTSGTYDAAATSAQGKSNINDNCRADQEYTFRTLGTSGSPQLTIGGYTFFKYSTNKTATGTNYNPGGTVNVGTTNKTYYAVYKPTEYTITQKYKFFESDGSTAVNDITQTDETDTAYATTPYTPSSPGVARKKYYKSSTTTFYVFVFDGWYTDASCEEGTEYSSTTYSSDDTIYAKMVAKEMTKVYVDTSNPNWSSPKVRVFKDGEEDFGLSNALTSGKMFSNNSKLYQLTVPVDYKLIFTANGAYGDNVQTVDIAVDSTSTDSYGHTKGTSDWIFLASDKENNHFKFNWQVFYGIGDDNSYYLVGDSNFENGSGNTPWTFAASNKMSTTGLPLSVIAKFENRTLTAGMEFQIWHFSAANGRDNMYAAINNDPETNAALNDTGSNIVVNTNVSGTFDIYVTETFKVMVKDVNAGSTLYVHSGANVDSYIMGKSPNSSSYWAVYEQGIHVTTTMATAGTYIGIVRQFGGKKIGYGTSASAYSFVDGSGSTSKTCGDISVTCLKINKPGYYNIYLRNNGTIMISSLPYLVNGSDVLTDGGDNGYYIIPYSSEVGNGSYRNGLKMNVINGENATTAEGNKNIASYSRYTATAGDKFVIKYFENNVTKYSPDEIATDETTVECLAREGNGVYRFVKSGIYNIYMYKTNDGQAISVAKDSLSDFSKLNSIPSTATTVEAVKNANTTLILDVTFTVTTPANVNISLDSVIDGAGLSSYVKYALFVDSDYSGASGTNTAQRVYNYFRGTPYSSLVAMRTNTTISASGSYASGPHHAYIVIDYDPSTVASMPNNIDSNFYFILKATQPSEA